MYKILAIDDESAITSILDKFLNKSGYQVIVANSGEQAIKIIFEQDDINLIILDIKMPGFSGVDVLNVLKKNNNKIPVIILSGSIGIQENVELLNDLGYDEHKVLYKPIDLNELLIRIKHVLKEDQTPP
ncbi:MAG: response regulator [Candidatus Omnitrophica bacterium]|nr:response regulator [Candidatus Omnitrophota bacterium]